VVDVWPELEWDGEEGAGNARADEAELEWDGEEGACNARADEALKNAAGPGCATPNL
jgi:hypothetical protein